MKGRHRCQASRESPGDSILPGSTVRASAAAMASLDVAVANCEGVILPERSASNWSASCGHMHTLYLQNNRDTHILYVPSTGLVTQSGRQGHKQLQELLFREAARWRFKSVLYGLNLRVGAQFQLNGFKHRVYAIVHTHHCLCVIRRLLDVSSIGGCICLSIEIGDSCCGRGQKLCAEVGRQGPSYRWVRI